MTDADTSSFSGLRRSVAGCDYSTRKTLKQARYWICTIPEADWQPSLVDGAIYLRGQLESGASGFRHWQIVVSFPAKKTLRQVKVAFGILGFHCEPTRSTAALDYVWKSDTRIGEPFEFGARGINRNSAHDWDRLRLLAVTGDLASIPGDIYIRYYSNLSR